MTKHQLLTLAFVIFTPGIAFMVGYMLGYRLGWAAGIDRGDYQNPPPRLDHKPQKDWYTPIQKKPKSETDGA